MEGLDMLADIFIAAVTIGLLIFLVGWMVLLSPHKAVASRAMLLFGWALELVAWLGFVVNWLENWLEIPQWVIDLQRAVTWGLVLAAVINLSAVLFIAWWRNDPPEEVFARMWRRPREPRAS
jgi:hypothetical protein